MPLTINFDEKKKYSTAGIDNMDSSPNMNAPSTSSTGQPITTTSSSTATGQGGTSLKVALKFLVSNGVAGSIIGRAGSTISELQTLSGCRIKLSQAGEYFPGTNERVCLIQGNADLVKRGLDLILHRFIFINDDEEQAITGSIPGNAQDSESSEEEDDEEQAVTGTAQESSHHDSINYHLRILIPSSACGLLIGRSGRHIKSISTASQTRVQLGQKEDVSSVATSERIFSVSGGKENVAQCVDILLDCIEKEIEEIGGVEENSVWRYVNMTTSYSKASIAATSAGRRGSGSFGGQVIVPRERDRDTHTSEKVEVHHGSGLLNSNSPRQVVIGGQLSSSVPQPFTANANTRESSPASSSQQQQSSRPNSQSTGAVDFTALPTSAASTASIVHAAAQVQLSTTPQLFKVEETVQQSTDNSNNTTSSNTDSHSITVAIPDPLIGSIIGHNGSTLTQLQLCSQTRIQISQRGEHMPGTNNRIVKIIGNKKENCDAAQFWIGQRIVMAQGGLDSGGGGKGHRRRHQGRGGGGGGNNNRGGGGRTRRDRDIDTEDNNN